MATVTLSAQTVDKDGLSAATYTAIDATDTYSFRNTDKSILHFKNTSTESTVTLDTPVTSGGIAVANPTVTVPATTGDVFVAMLPLSVFNSSAGLATFTQDVASGVTVALLQL